jgi:microcystin-dependent protein
MWADGSLLNTVEYPDLFAVLGVTYGTGGPGTFNLPDCRGRMTVAAGSGPGLTARTAGQTGGAETVALAEANHAVHAHTIGGSSSGDIPPHQHTGTSDGQSVDHGHSVSLATGPEGASHNHNIPDSQLTTLGTGAPASNYFTTHATNQRVSGNENQTHTHAVSGATAGSSAGHTHSFTSANPIQGHTHPLPATTAVEGGGAAHQNMPPWIAIGKVIKVKTAQNQ